VTNPAPGFIPLTRRSPYTDLLGPIYSNQEGNNLELGICAEAKHCNARGFVHGGVLCTLADIAMGYNTVLATAKPTGMLTANLSIDFVGSAQVDDWIIVRVDVQKVGGTLAFANCYFYVDEQRIARASAIFCRPRNKETSTAPVATIVEN